MTALRRFLLALQFLTGVTLWPRLTARDRDLAGSMLFYPLIGLILGLALAACRLLLDFWPPLLADAVVVALMVAFTRGLHLEGLADAADGLGPARGREESLRIMKDSACGAFGVMAVVLLLILKWAALISIGPELKIRGLILAPLIGRFVMVAASYRTPYARSEAGLATPFVEGLKGVEVIVGALFTLVAAVLILGHGGGLIFVGGVVWAFLVRTYSIHRLGGVTGDIIGAGGELAELGVLLSLAATRF